MADARLAARRYTRAHGEDDPAIADWAWDSDYRAARGRDQRPVSEPE
jgi:xylulose-5-phosphate/fructose-6-phosphate phosphoketolase